MVKGNDPLKKLLERSRWRRCSILPKSGEIEPKSWLFGRTKLVTLNMSGVPGGPSSAHVTPFHEQGVRSL